MRMEIKRKVALLVIEMKRVVALLVIGYTGICIATAILIMNMVGYTTPSEWVLNILIFISAIPFQIYGHYRLNLINERVP